jgi:hypothetical protein
MEAISSSNITPELHTAKQTGDLVSALNGHKKTKQITHLSYPNILTLFT